MKTPEEKITTLDQAIEIRKIVKKIDPFFDSFKFVITNGCFDILHRGHLEYLRRAKELTGIRGALFGGALFVLINNDESVHRLREIRGEINRPINNENDRAYQLASLSFVDGVVICPHDNFTYEIYALKPDIYVKGGDYNYDSLNYEELTALQRVNAEIKFIPFVKGYSTTNIIRKIKGSLCETDLCPFKHLNK